MDPQASDGQSLSGQSSDTQAAYQAAYGADAAQKWANDHNASIGPQYPNASTTNLPAPTGMGDPTIGPGTTGTSGDMGGPGEPIPGGGDGGGGDKQQQGTDYSQYFQSLDAQLNSLMQALTATNEQDFQEKVREFNANHDLAMQQFGLSQQQFGLSQAGLTGMYNGQPTLANLGQQAQYTGLYNGKPTLQSEAQQAQLTGMFNGQPTPAYQQMLAQITGMYNGNPTEQAREFNTNTQTDLAKLSSSLTGPADYYQYLNSLNQGRNILSGLTGGQGNMPNAAAPVGNVQTQSLQNIMGGLGINTGGSTAQNNNTGANLTVPGLGMQLPYANQINPSYWDSIGSTGQSFIKGLYSAAGMNPNDLESQINATRPAAMSPSSSSMGMSNSGGTTFAGAGSQSAFG